MLIKVKLILFCIYLLVSIIYFIYNYKRIGKIESGFDIEGYDANHKVSICSLFLESILWPVWILLIIPELLYPKETKEKYIKQFKKEL